MIAIKVQCACGQRFAFDVEPVNGRMPALVACPVCGADGTAAANESIAQVLGVPPPTAPAAAPVVVLAPPTQAAAGGLRLNVPALTRNDPVTPPPIPAGVA